MDMTIMNIVLSIVSSLALLIFILGVVGGIIFYILQTNRYDFFCKIYERAGNNLLILRETEKAGVFVDKKTNYKRLWLKKNKVGLNPDNPPYIINEKGKKVIHLLKDGTKTFRYIDIKVLEQDKIILSVTEEDVNWAVTDYERVKKLVLNDFITKVLPYIGLIILGVFIIGMVAMVLKDFKEIVPVLNEILVSLQQLRSGTQVLQ